MAQRLVSAVVALRQLGCALAGLAALHTGGPLTGPAHAQADVIDPPPPAGQTPEASEQYRPSSARRIVQVWDFEDELADLREIPENWVRVIDQFDSASGLPENLDNLPIGEDATVHDDIRADFPAFNLARFTQEAAHTGEWSVKLPVRGGSTKLQLAAGVLPALPGAQYMLSGHVLTDRLNSARARMSMTFLGADLMPLPEESHHTPLAMSEGDWSIITTKALAPPEAAWIVIAIEALQREHYDLRERSEHDIEQHDVEATVYFDDLRLYQVPQVKLSTQNPVNVIVAPEQPEAHVMLRDLTGERMVTELRVYDVAGNMVWREVKDAPDDGLPETSYPEIDRFGWYRMVLRVASPQGVIAQQKLDFAWVPPPGGAESGELSRFGLLLEPVDPDMIPHLPQLVASTRSGAVQLPVWGHRERPLDAESAMRDPTAAAQQKFEDDEELNRVVEEMLNAGVEVSFALSLLPQSVARAHLLDPEDVMGLLSQDAEVWSAYLTELLTRFGERVLRWQIGDSTRSLHFAGPELADQVQRIRTQLYKLVPSPRIAVPWHMNQVPPANADLLDSLTIRMPKATNVQAIGQHIEHWPEDLETVLVVDVPDAEIFGQEAAIIEMVRRTIAAWQGGVDVVAIDQPWVFYEDIEDERVISEPKISLPIWRGLIERLAGRKAVGELPVAEGAVAVIAADEHTGSLIAWNETASNEDARVRGFIGAGPITVRDALGNITPITLGKGGTVDIPLTDEPLYIEGIDVKLAQFRAGLEIEPAFLPSRAELHSAEFVIRNPWDTSVTGAIRFADTGDWNIAPKVFTFALPAGAEERVPISVQFALNAETGQQEILTQVRLAAEGSYPVMEMPVPVEIGLEEIQMNASYRYVPGPSGEMTDIVVTVLVTNVSDQEISVEAFASAPGYAAQSSVFILRPGESSINPYLFPGGAEKLRDQVVRVGLRERPGTGRLNKRLHIR